MKILAFEFSSPERSVAVLAEEGARSNTALGEAMEAGPRAIGAFAMTDLALKHAGLEREQIECIAVGLGPGSYTGIRAAIALAQGWELARGTRLLGISSVECIAAEACSMGLTGKVAVLVDAQRQEFYLAEYELQTDDARELEPLRLVNREQVVNCLAKGAAPIGPEVLKWFPEGRIVFPRAATLARLAKGRTDFVHGNKLEPIYLRETQFVKAPPPRKLPL
jgi:tRNA threonylcarbamoyl adenosine modification protein YeaZ